MDTLPADQQDTLLADLAKLAQQVDLHIAGLVLLLCAVFGAAGGLAAQFLQYDQAGSKGGNATLLGPWKSMYVGGVGAVGFLFFTLAVGGIAAQFSTLDQVLRTVSTSVIAGFGARRLLPSMVSHVEKRISDVANQTKSVDLQRERLEVNINLREAATPTASAVLRESAIKDAEALIKQGGASSATWVALARTHRWNKRLEAAIDALNRGEAAIKSGAVDDKNLAALYYNRGCYRALLHSKNTSAEEKLKALDDLSEFFALADKPKHEADIISEDKDWESLADDDRFKAIVSQWAAG